MYGAIHFSCALIHCLVQWYRVVTGNIILCIYRISRFIGESIFGESVGNRCCRYFNLAETVAAIHINGYKTILALFKFGGQTKIAKPIN